MSTIINDLIIYGSHNTMTYLPIKNWWLFPGLLIARCQKHTYIEQFTKGARVFNLRIYFNGKTRMWEFAHGLINFKSPWVNQVIRDLYDLAATSEETVYVRLILEKWNTESESAYFAAFCEEMEKTFGTILKFIGGNRKGDWKKVYTFKNDVSDTLNNQWVSSMAEDAKGLEKYIPVLYAKKHNEQNKLKMKEKFNLFDFI